MDEQVAAALGRARNALAFRPERVTKTMWSSPAGKKKLAKRLAALLPPHRTYVEPFAGSAAVFFAKGPAEVEVLNDADIEIADAYRAIKRLTSEQLARLRRMSWTGAEARYKRIYDSKPSDAVVKLHRFLYLAHFSYGKMRGRSFSPSLEGVTAQTMDRVEACRPRLRNTRVFGGDYEKVVRKFDAADTLFFFDPPYPGYDVNVGESSFDEERFLETLKSLKGKFLLTYGIRGKLPQLLKRTSFQVRRIRTPRSIRAMRGVAGPKVLTQLVVANYKMDAIRPAATKSSTGRDASGDDVSYRYAKTIPLIKGVDPNDERYVLGIVLEPEVVDAQGDIYSAAEIRQAAHRFMEDFGGLGLMHRFIVNGQVKVLESYLAPADLDIGDVRVRKGTWLLAVRVLSDELWEQVKDGRLTGFSIGGSARRVPEQANQASEEERSAA